MIRPTALFALVIALGVGAGLRDHLDSVIDATVLPPMLSETSVEVHDRDGALLRVYPVENGRVRLPLDLAEVDPDFVAMLIAYEDKRFYRHGGIDLRALARAVVQAALQGHVVSGGSTLTMQVARLLENGSTGRWHGKLRQMRVALALERRLSKDQILSLYLAHAPYGGPVEGLRAGSIAWFGKEPARLTQAEAALLVALPQSPETRRPDRFGDAAKTARARVLARTGAPEQMRLSSVPPEMRGFPRLAPHLTDAEVARNPGKQRIDLTLDANLQARLEDLSKRAVDGLGPHVSAAIVVADHRTGEVLGSVGSPAYSDRGGVLGFVDMTRAVRSPGSTLKPFIYAIAFDQGLAHPDTLITDAPVTFGRYAPQNFDGQFRGDVTVREALQLSLNIPPVLLTHEIGPARLLATLRRGGARPQLSGGTPGLAVALGGVGMTLNDLVQLYGGLANGGVVQPLRWGKAGETTPARILSEVAAWQVSHILTGLAPPARVARHDRSIAYKTGTSYGHRDAWAIGFDGRHVIGVWLGRPDGTPVPGAFGGDLAAPILFEAFDRLKAEPAPMPPPPPDALILSSASLPVPLQRFRGRDAACVPKIQRPEVSFPPHGAVLRQSGDGILLKLRAGVMPLTVLINGRPSITGLRRRDATLPPLGPGYSRISVIDARGMASDVTIRIE